MNPAVEFDPALLTAYDVAGPRYTSYPTAPHFHSGVGVDQYVDALRNSNEDPIPRPLSLYAHVPFCFSPCFYCGCNRIITRDRDRAATYLGWLTREIDLHARLVDRDRKVVQLHLGGGTPNFLDAGQLEELVDHIDDAFRLAPEKEREFGIEVDPRFAEPDFIRALGAIGFNRISLGVQDIDPVVQQAINRLQPFEMTRQVMDAARASGFNSINLDLIYGLPKQTRAGFGTTLDTVIASAPNRIALYSYAHLPSVFRAQRQIDDADLPAPAEKLALLGLAIEKLSAAGYRYIGMDHFARPDDELAKAQDDGTLVRNFQGYSTHGDCDLIGLGVSSIGHVGDCFVQNYRDVVAWEAALSNGELPIAKGHVASTEDRLRSEIVQRLMCDGELEFRNIEHRFGIGFESHFGRELERVKKLAADGLVRIDGRHIEVTPRGRLLLRIVAMSFDAYLDRPAGTPKFSKVI